MDAADEPDGGSSTVADRKPPMLNEHSAPAGYLARLERDPNFAYPGRQDWNFDHRQLRAVNDEENRTPYVSDTPGHDVWGDGNDCEDFAIRKMERLMRETGAPRGAFRFAAVDLWGRQHAVLIVGDSYVLDNLTDEIYQISAYPGNLLAMEDENGKWRGVTRKTLTWEDLVK